MYWGYYFCYIYTHYTQYTGKCQWTAQYILTHTLHLRSIKKIVGDLHEYIQRPYISIHLYATWTVQLRSYTWQMQFSSYRTYKAFNGLKAQTTTHTHKSFPKSICSGQFCTWKMRARLTTWCWMISASQAWNGDSWVEASQHMTCESCRVVPWLSP